MFVTRPGRSHWNRRDTCRISATLRVAARSGAQCHAAQTARIGQVQRGHLYDAIVNGVSDRVVSRCREGAFQIAPGPREIARPARKRPVVGIDEGNPNFGKLFACHPWPLDGS